MQRSPAVNSALTTATSTSENKIKQILLSRSAFPLKINRISIQVTLVDDLKPSEKNYRVDRPGYQDDIDITREDATDMFTAHGVDPFST